MNMTKIIAVLISALMLFSLTAVITASAETEPSEAFIDTEPYTEIVTYPPTDATDYTEEYTEPTEYTEYTEAVEPTTEFIRPTEFPENYQPNTNSNYVSPEPAYTPGEQDFNEVAWEKIELDLSNNNSSGLGDFSNIKNNTNRGDSNNYTLLIVGIILITLAVAGVTFAILYNPKLLARRASANASSSASNGRNVKTERRTAPERTRSTRPSGSGRSSSGDRRRSQSLEQKRRNYDDYNDGY